MKSVNTVTLLGNVSRDPEIRVTPAGSVASFGLITNRVWKDKAGNRQSLAEFHSIVAWDSLAEICSQYVRKGKPLYVKGYLKTRTWDDENEKHYMTEVVAQDVILLSARSSIAQPEDHELAA